MRVRKSAVTAPITPGNLTEKRCEAVFEFGNPQCEREEGHPGPHYARWGGPVWFNSEGKRVHGGSAEDVGI